MNIAATLRARRARNRGRRAIQRAIDNAASSPALRDELLMIQQRHETIQR
ncbi:MULTISPECIES: hypothetical protein [Actinoalloteichus]|uniref:Uncharacterized protein n=1 Tax=Actinoalloteichus caeruleus DSM 43889 TaxID=1120930 RepID=A0ABT1JL06_ACTCY|nr:hypothetical protein [Actinoalloteichus caeruleus]MCP2333032.1 hypothetical protein [Actinoalloteichus caeruleus DSM 43889]